MAWFPAPDISLCGFSRPTSAANSTVQGLILPNFKPIRDLVSFLVACKKEEDQIKMKALEWSQHYSLIFQTLKGS